MHISMYVLYIHKFKGQRSKQKKEILTTLKRRLHAIMSR